MTQKKIFNVYFEIYGKKMRVAITAESSNHAKELVNNKLIFHKVKEKKMSEYVDPVDIFRDIFGMS